MTESKVFRSSNVCTNLAHMTTHREEYMVQTSVLVPAPGSETGAWIDCPDLPDVLGEARIRSCEDLTAVMESQGGIVARLLRLVAHCRAFRLLARERWTGTLAGWVEWVRNEVSGAWQQWDEPWTGCDAGQHCPPGLLGLVA